MEKHIAAFSGACLLPRYARILKPGTYGSPVAPPSSNGVLFFVGASPYER